MKQLHLDDFRKNKNVHNLHHFHHCPTETASFSGNQHLSEQPAQAPMTLFTNRYHHMQSRVNDI